MSQQHNNQPTGRTKAVQSKTMFFNEGNTTAAVVTNYGTRHDATMMEFLSAEAALAWCRKNMVMLVYMPCRLEAN